MLDARLISAAWRPPCLSLTIIFTKSSSATCPRTHHYAWGLSSQAPWHPTKFKKSIAGKAAQITESVTREMARLALEHDAINLSQGFPAFPAPDVLKKAAPDAIF